MTYDLAEDGTLTELPMKNIDTGMGLERMAAVLQGVDSVFDTDAPAAAGRPRRGALGPLLLATDGATTRAMRILADHSRGTAALIADGVVPSNEDRGYVLRRIMRRAIQQGRSIDLQAPFMERFADRALDLLGARLPRAGGRARHRDALGQPTRRRASAARSSAARRCSRT